MDNKADPNYLAFLVRMWREEGGGWRSTVENPHTGERRAFADVGAMLAFLQRQTVDSTSTSKEDDWLDLADF
jgi:hypothetical protein